jgi:hypothetical protein
MELIVFLIFGIDNKFNLQLTSIEGNERAEVWIFKVNTSGKIRPGRVILQSFYCFCCQTHIPKDLDLADHGLCIAEGKINGSIKLPKNTIAIPFTTLPQTIAILNNLKLYFVAPAIIGI